MNAHEEFVLLAAKQIDEPLSESEAADLEQHLATCPTCRSIAAGMRRDDSLLKAELVGARVSPRVRRRVLEEARGRPHVSRGLMLGLAAALTLTAIGVPLIVGAGAQPGLSTATEQTPGLADRRSVPLPSPSPVPVPSSSASPMMSTAPAAAPASSAASAAPSGWSAFVAAAYRYGPPTRLYTVSAHLAGGPVGEWSRQTRATGQVDSFSGPISCLVMSGSDAWLAGPATSASDGSKGRAVFIYLHDGGPSGKHDRAELWLTTPGQTLAMMTGWCESRFIPSGPHSLTTGDIEVHDGPS
jgi:hypothetical protein